ncbi:uncharacterized protein TNCV_36851 [Trichonephila clavipes]|nr:uncharacterized protein TNCV_36851 [Trichonephila clavipes]
MLYETITIIKPVLTYGSETWILTKSQIELPAIFERKVCAVNENRLWRQRHNFELYKLFKEKQLSLYTSRLVVRVARLANRLPSMRADPSSNRGRNIEKLFDEARQNRRKQHKHWEKYYNRKRREVNIKVRVYCPRQSDTISSDSHVETLYEGQRSSDRSSRSLPGKFKGSRKTSSEQNNGHKSSKGNAGWEDPRLKRTVDSNGSGDTKNIKRYKICRKRSLQGSEHRDQKRPTPEPKQGIKRAIPSSISSRNHKYRRPNNPSQGSQPIAGPSHQQDSRQDRSPTVASRHEGSGQYNKARERKTTKNGTNRADERTVRSNQMTAVRPCRYYLRSRVRQPEGFPEERRNSGIVSIPQNNIRSRILSMEALDGDPVDKSE